MGPQNAEICVNMTVTGAATLHWLPQETILFDGAGFSRHLDVHVGERTNFLASEMMVFGRTAMQKPCARVGYGTSGEYGAAAG